MFFDKWQSCKILPGLGPWHTKAVPVQIHLFQQPPHLHLTTGCHWPWEHLGQHFPSWASCGGKIKDRDIRWDTCVHYHIFAEFTQRGEFGELVLYWGITTGRVKQGRNKIVTEDGAQSSMDREAETPPLHLVQEHVRNHCPGVTKLGTLKALLVWSRPLRALPPIPSANTSVGNCKCFIWEKKNIVPISST